MSSTITMENWEVLIKNESELPAFFKETYHGLELGREVFPYTIYLPEDRNPFTKRKDTLIIITSEEIYIFKKLGAKVKRVVFRFKDIECLERNTY